MSRTLQAVHRSNSIGVKVTEADFAMLQALAKKEGKPLAEWCRDALVEFARHPAGAPIEQALLAEVIALRTIVSNLIYTFGSDGKVTPQQMTAFIDRANKTKLNRAAEFLSEVHKRQESPVLEEPQPAGGRR